MTSRKTRIAVLGGTSYVADSYAMTSKLYFGHTGNTGNLAFRHAVPRLVAEATTRITYRDIAEQINASFDLVMIPCANFLGTHTDLGNQAKLIEQLKVPLLPIGLGAQAPSDGVFVKLSEGTERWAKAVAERAPVVWTRGEYSAEVLARLGILNTAPLGCPSLFINPSPTLGENVAERLAKGSTTKIAIAAGNPMDQRPLMATLEQRLFQMAMSYDAAYITQSPAVMVALGRGDLSEVREIELKRVHEVVAPQMPRKDFVRAARRRFIAFQSIDAWLEYLRGCDVVIGQRIHGTALGVQAGIPGICLAHDSRTQELATTMKLPHLPLEKLLAAESLERAVKQTTFDGPAFDLNRRTLAMSAIGILEKLEVAPSEHLRCIAGLATLPVPVLRPRPAADSAKGPGEAS